MGAHTDMVEKLQELPVRRGGGVPPGSLLCDRARSALRLRRVQAFCEAKLAAGRIYSARGSQQGGPKGFLSWGAHTDMVEKLKSYR